MLHADGREPGGRLDTTASTADCYDRDVSKQFMKSSGAVVHDAPDFPSQTVLYLDSLGTAESNDSDHGLMD